MHVPRLAESVDWARVDADWDRFRKVRTQLYKLPGESDHGCEQITEACAIARSREEPEQIVYTLGGGTSELTRER